MMKVLYCIWFYAFLAVENDKQFFHLIKKMSIFKKLSIVMNPSLSNLCVFYEFYSSLLLSSAHILNDREA